MSPAHVVMLGRMLAAFTRVLGMQALNMQRAAVGSSMAYDDASFFTEADKLEQLADEPFGSPPRPKRLFVVFDGPPSHESGRFVELEDEDGHGMSLADGGWSGPDARGMWKLGPFVATVKSS